MLEICPGSSSVREVLCKEQNAVSIQHLVRRDREMDADTEERWGSNGTSIQGNCCLVFLFTKLP